MKFLIFLLVMAWLPMAAVVAQDSDKALYQEAQRAYLTGDYETAKQKFETVLEMNPKNVGARNYLRSINGLLAKSGGGKLKRELEAIKIPEVKLRDASLETVLEFLKQQAEAVSGGQTVVNFVPQLPKEALATPVTLSLQNVPFPVVLRYVGDMAGVTFDVQEYAIVVKPKAVE